MSEENNQEKTEEPTPRKRQELREKGEVAKSRELPSVAVLLASLMALTFFGSFMYSQIQLVMQETFLLPMLNDLNVSAFIIFAHKVTTRFIFAMSPLLATIFITALLSNIMQVGFVLSAESITPKLSKIDPIKGFTRLFSKQSLMELCKSLLKLAIISAISYYTIKAEMKNVPMLGEMGVKAIWVYMLTVFLKIFLRCTLAMVVVVVSDYAFQRWEFENRIKMSKQEIKDEHKKSEGDPLVKSRIKSIQMEMAKKRMMQSVPEADVVITNPVRLAVAIKYDPEMSAPKVLAKGAGEVAKKIRELAAEHDIPIMEKKELARQLYKLVEIGQEIPAVFYQAVAEILAYIYRLKGNVGL